MNLYKYKLLQYYFSKEYNVYDNPIIANGFNDDIKRSCFKIKIPQHILGSYVSDNDLNDYFSYNINIQSDSLNDYTFYVIGTPNVVGKTSWNRYDSEKGIDIKVGNQHADTIIYIISDSSSTGLNTIDISYKYNISNNEISSLSPEIQNIWKEYFPWEYDGNGETVICTKSTSTNNSGNYKYISFDNFKNYDYSIGANLYTSIQVFGQYEALNYILRKMSDDENIYNYSGRHITFNGTNITNINGLSIDINQYCNKKSFQSDHTSDLGPNDASWLEPIFKESCITSLPYLGTVYNYISGTSDGKTIIKNEYSADNGIPLRYGRGSHSFGEPGLSSAFQNCDLLSIGSDNAFPLPWYGDMKTTITEDGKNKEYFINKLTMGSGTFSGCFYDCEELDDIYVKFYNFTSIPTSELTNDEHINLAFFSNYNKTSTDMPTGFETIGTYSSVNSIDRLLSCFNESGFNKLDVHLIDFPIPIKTYNYDDNTYYDPNSPAWKTYYNYICNLMYSSGGNVNLYFVNKDSYKDSYGNSISIGTNFINDYKPASLNPSNLEIKYWLLYLKLYFDFNQNNFVDYTETIENERFKSFVITIPNIAYQEYNTNISYELSGDKWNNLIESKIINITINDNKYYLTTKKINAVEVTTDTNGNETIINPNITLTVLGFNINNKFYALNTNLEYDIEKPAGSSIPIHEILKANCNSYITINDPGNHYSSPYFVQKTSNGYKASKFYSATYMPYSFNSNGISKLGCTCID